MIDKRSGGYDCSAHSVLQIGMPSAASSTTRLSAYDEDV